MEDVTINFWFWLVLCFFAGSGVTQFITFAVEWIRDLFD